MNDLLSVRQAATVLGVCHTLVYEAIKDGSLGHYRFGRGKGVIRISQAHLDDYRDRCFRGPEPAKPSVQPRTLKPESINRLRKMGVL